MKINSVLINNYKGINASLGLNDGINVITGKNGTGKSNILEAIRVALGIEAPNKENIISGEKSVALIKVILSEKMFLDKYSVLKKIYRSGEIKTYYNDSWPDNQIDCLLLDYDSHCFMNNEKLAEFALSLKEQAKTKQIIIISNSKEILDIADCVLETSKIGNGYTLLKKAVA